MNVAMLFSVIAFFVIALFTPFIALYDFHELHIEFWWSVYYHLYKPMHLFSIWIAVNPNSYIYIYCNIARWREKHVQCVEGKFWPMCIKWNMTCAVILLIKLHIIYKKNEYHNVVKSGGRLNIKMSSYQYRDPHVKDKTVSRPSYL